MSEAALWKLDDLSPLHFIQPLLTSPMESHTCTYQMSLQTYSMTSTGFNKDPSIAATSLASETPSDSLWHNVNANFLETLENTLSLPEVYIEQEKSRESHNTPFSMRKRRLKQLSIGQQHEERNLPEVYVKQRLLLPMSAGNALDYHTLLRPGIRHMESTFHFEKYESIHMNDDSQNMVHVCTHVGCGKTFTRRANLRQHAQLHKADRLKFPCLNCGIKFTRRHDLRVHGLKRRCEKRKKSRGKGLRESDWGACAVSRKK